MSDTVEKPAVVLTADDDPVTSQILLAYLEVEGYEVLLAADGDEAIALAKANPPDAVILDYNIPPTNGADVARALRADPTTQHAGIALLTASTELVDNGAEEDLWNARLSKPVDQPYLASIVASLIAGAHALLRENAPEAPDAPLPDDPIQAEFVSRLRDKVPQMRQLARCEANATAPGSPLRVLRRHLQQIEGSAKMCGFPEVELRALEAAQLLDSCLGAIEAGAESHLDDLRASIETIAALAKTAGSISPTATDRP